MRELLELHHAAQRVLVDRVDMVEIANHHRPQLAELGDQRAERADVVHRAQRLVDPRTAAQDLEERLDHRLRLTRELDLEGRGRQELARAAADLDAVALRLEEHADDVGGILEHFGLVDDDLATRDAHARPDATAEDAPEPAVAAALLEAALDHELLEAVQARRVQIVTLQEALDRAAIVGVMI